MAKVKDLVDRVRLIMYGSSASDVMDLVTSTMYGYDSQTTATGNKPNEINLAPITQDLVGLQVEHAVFTFGRFSVPTAGHTRLIERVLEEAGENPHFIFPTHSHDSEKNPIVYEDKIGFMKSAWPEANIVEDDVRTLFDAIQYLEKTGFKSATLVVGEDRRTTFQKLLETYANDYAMTIGVVAVDRTDDDISATKAREAIVNEDFDAFWEMCPENLSEEERIDLGLAVHYGMVSKRHPTLKEQVEAKLAKAATPIPGETDDNDTKLGKDDIPFKTKFQQWALRRRQREKLQKIIIDNP